LRIFPVTGLPEIREGDDLAAFVTDRLTLVYEQGLTLATQALRIEYELTRSLTIRAEAGTYGALGLYFRRTFD